MSLTPAQQRIVAMADELAARFAERAPRHDAESSFPHENWLDLHSSGYLRLVIPRQYGGEGASVLDMVIAQERLGRGCASTALGAAMLISVLGRAVEIEAWPEPVMAEVCRELAGAGGGLNNCVTETELGSISRGGTPLTGAERVEGGWLVSGHKIFVTAAPALRFLVTGLVLPGDDESPKGYMASAIVRNPSPGLRIERTWRDALSLRAAGNDDVYYERVFVPDEWVVERRAIGSAPKAAGPGANPWALTVAAVYLGVGQAALEAACDYARNRVPPSLGTPIAGQLHIQQAIGSMQIQLDAARTVLRDVARAWTEEPDAKPALAPRIATAKYLATNAGCTVTETALRVAGGFSLTHSLPLERYFRDSRAGLFAPPQDDLALGIAGRAALAEKGPPAATARAAE
ncbi:MAG: acyl-CoA/acyl-ACP dehydrogenase [Acetobacteraceae bacterium]|nr:acyl-CoA/acyl-ACP dehydrogenase [Acetobacteraceae bacterium]